MLTKTSLGGVKVLCKGKKDTFLLLFLKSIYANLTLG